MRPLDSNGFRLLLDYYRLLPLEADRVADGDSTMRMPRDVVRTYRQAQTLGVIPRDREAFCIALLNTRHKVLVFHVVSVGNANHSIVHPREVFRPAIAVGAHAMIVAHHHPSGDATPSHEDRRITDRLTEAGELLGIAVLDHLVIGAERFFSFSEGSYQAEVN
jgi:DNA repair protein RadC